jgi:hypothetical protein
MFQPRLPESDHTSNSFNVNITARLKGYKAMTKRNAVSGMCTPNGSCKNRFFRETWLLRYQGDKNR